MNDSTKKANSIQKYLELIGPISIIIALILVGVSLYITTLRWLSFVGVFVFAIGQYCANYFRMRNIGFGSKNIQIPTKIVERPKSKHRFEQQNRQNHTARTFSLIVGVGPVFGIIWAYPFVKKQILNNHLNPTPVLLSALAILVVCFIVTWWSVVMALVIERGDNYVDLLPDGIRIYSPAGLGAFRNKEPAFIRWEDLVLAKVNPGMWPWGIGLELVARDPKSNEARIWLLNSLMFNVKDILKAIKLIVDLDKNGIAQKENNDY